MQDCTDAADAEIQSFLKVNEGVVIPDLMPEFFSRHQFAWLQGEHREDFGGLGLESENLPALPQLATCKVELELIEPQHVEMARGTQSGSGTG
jgi:hypothetical protein